MDFHNVIDFNNKIRCQLRYERNIPKDNVYLSKEPSVRKCLQKIHRIVVLEVSGGRTVCFMKEVVHRAINLSDGPLALAVARGRLGFKQQGDPLKLRHKL